MSAINTYYTLANFPAWGFQNDRCNADAYLKAKFPENWQTARIQDRNTKLKSYIPFYGVKIGIKRFQWVNENPDMPYRLAHRIRAIFEIALGLFGVGCLLAIPDALMTGYREGVADCRECAHDARRGFTWFNKWSYH